MIRELELAFARPAAAQALSSSIQVNSCNDRLSAGFCRCSSAPDRLHTVPDTLRTITELRSRPKSRPSGLRTSRARPSATTSYIFSRLWSCSCFSGSISAAGLPRSLLFPPAVHELLERTRTHLLAVAGSTQVLPSLLTHVAAITIDVTSFPKTFLPLSSVGVARWWCRW